MPLKLVPPRSGQSSNYRVRGTYLGVKVDRSTKAPGRAQAGKVLKEIEREIERGRFQKKLGPTFGDAVARYLRDGKDHRFVDRLLDRFEHTPIADIDQSAIEDAAHELYPAASPATRNRQVFTPMSAILQHAGVDLRLRRPAGGNGARRDFVFRQEQVEDLVAAAQAQEPEFGLLLTFLLYTGCRLSEALSLQVEDVDLGASTAVVRDTKNGLDRRVHLPPVLLAALAGHPQGLQRVGRVFRYHKGQRLYQRLERAAEASGVVIPDGLGFHAFRHTWASWMRRYAGLDTTGLVATGAWLSADAARRYEHAVASEEAQRADLLPVIGRKA
jgi:integrase